MNKIQLLLLDIMKCAIFNTPVEAIELNDEEAIQLLQLAQMHHIAPLIYDKIYMYLSPQIKALYGKSISQQSIFQTIRTENFLRIYQQMLTEGFMPLVFKGIVCRNTYPNPDLRLSGDEDIFIEKKDQKRMDTFLINQGFVREGDYSDDEDEIGYRSQALSLYLEVHVLLFSKDSPYSFFNDYFSDVFEHKVSIDMQGRTIYTLDYTKHLIYLLTHSYKHFVHGGFGIRQVCDMIMFMHTYYEYIDYQEVDAFMNQYSLDCFWSNLLDIGRQYLGFDEEKAHYHIKGDYIDSDDLLMDLMQSGIYGRSSFERTHSANMTLEAIGSNSSSTTRSIMKSLFPSPSYIKSSYNYVKKYPILLPIGYIHRIISYLISKQSHDKQSSVEIGKQRISLLKKYRIIK